MAPAASGSGTPPSRGVIVDRLKARYRIAGSAHGAVPPAERLHGAEPLVGHEPELRLRVADAGVARVDLVEEDVRHRVVPPVVPARRLRVR